MRILLITLMLLLSSNTNAQFFKDVYKDFLKYGTVYAAGNVGNSYITSRPTFFIRTDPDDLYAIPDVIDESIYKKLAIEKIEKELGNMYWYDKKVFEVYYNERHTLDSLAKKTGISRNSLFTTLKKVRTKLKEILNGEIFCDE